MHSRIYKETNGRYDRYPEHGIIRQSESGPRRYKIGSLARVLRVRKMRCKHCTAACADVVTLVADDLNLVGGNIADWLAIVRITEDNDFVTSKKSS